MNDNALDAWTPRRFNRPYPQAYTVRLTLRATARTPAEAYTVDVFDVSSDGRSLTLTLGPYAWAYFPLYRVEEIAVV